MLSDLQAKTDVRQAVEPELSPDEPLRALAPTPFSSAIESRLRRMPSAGRWVLGIGLAFLSGLGFLSSMSGPVFVVAPGIPVVVMCAIALAAGFVLSSWWAVPALVATACAGGTVAGWVVNQVYLPVNWISLDPGGLRSEVQFFFILLAGLPLIIFLLAGTALGIRSGMALERLSEPLPPSAPSAAPPPVQPRSRLAASIQRIPLSGRWTLGLGLAFLSGLAVLIAPYANASNSSPTLTAGGLIVMCMLALAAGLVLSSWWAAPMLAFAASASGLMVSWGLTRTLPGEAGGEMGAIEWFATVALGPLIAFLLAGISIGKQQLITLEQPRALNGGEAAASAWIVAIGMMIAAGYLAGITGVAYTGGSTVFRVLFGILNAIVIAAVCLLAGWLLRSWQGFVATPLVYAGVAALMAFRFGNGGVGLLPVLTGGFVLYIVLPAVVMSAIGTASGMLRVRRR